MPSTSTLVDPRGLRFAATLTALVLAIALVSGSGWILAGQTLVFAVGALAGPAASPYGRVYAWFVRPRLAAPARLEDAAAPRFAQTVGLVFGLVGLAGHVAALELVTYVAVGAAFAAAFLNAAFGFCLGCEIYLTYRRFTPSHHPNPTTEVAS